MQALSLPPLPPFRTASTLKPELQTQTAISNRDSKPKPQTANSAFSLLTTKDAMPRLSELPPTHPSYKPEPARPFKDSFTDEHGNVGPEYDEADDPDVLHEPESPKPTEPTDARPPEPADFKPLDRRRGRKMQPLDSNHEHSEANYRKHRRRGEDPCDGCRTAHSRTVNTTRSTLTVDEQVDRLINQLLDLITVEEALAAIKTMDERPITLRCTKRQLDTYRAVCPFRLFTDGPFLDDSTEDATRTRTFLANQIDRDIPVGTNNPFYELAARHKP